MMNADARQRIEAAIKDAERGTRAEFVGVFAHRADDYDETSYAAGLIVGFATGSAAWAIVPWVNGGEVLAAFLAGFLVVFALTRFTSLGIRLTPRAIRERAARRLARLIFLERGLASTEEHCGVMFFVAQGERYAEIIADRGIDRKVDAGSWQKVVNDFTAAVRGGELEKGFAAAISAIGTILAQHYPATGENPNEISNRLIEI